MMAFFMATQLPLPKPMSQYVTISMNMGTKKPRIEKQKAPIKLMKGPIVGTATARRTASEITKSI